LSASALTQLLSSLSQDELLWPEFLVTLPVSGVDGTLKRRLKDPHARRLVRAKTGRLANVVALSGVAPVGPDRQAVFAVLVNDYHCPTWKIQDAVDRVVLALLDEAPAAKEPRKRIPSGRLTVTKPAPSSGVAEGS
jgi:D-alanyl-D-alanine carboxypeptidase/D-alanyl-D-alanine-endopeptidase (penicillin-binding protein 4)